MQPAPPKQRLKRVPVWPLWGALVALGVASFGFLMFAVVLMAHVLSHRRTYLASVARVYSFKRIRSRRVRKLIAASPVAFALSWPFPFIIRNWRKETNEAAHAEDWAIEWGFGFALLFLAIHIFNQWRIRKSTKQLASNAQLAP